MSERRRAPRVSLELPAALVSRDGPIPGEVRDLSVLGARLFVLTGSLGLPPEPTLLETALAVRDALGPRFEVRLDHEHAGEVRRIAGVARLALPPRAHECVEVGCEFATPLTAQEFARLTGGLLEVATAGAATADAPPSRLEARVRGLGRGEFAPLVCRAEALDPERLELCVGREALRSVDAAEATVTFARRYGSRVRVELRSPEHGLWSGGAEVCAMEASTAHPDDLRISLGYDRPLRPADLARLRVA